MKNTLKKSVNLVLIWGLLINMIALMACKPVITFTNDDFPIGVGMDCVKHGSNYCIITQSAIDDFNAQIGLEVFEFYPDSLNELIQIDFVDSFSIENRIGQTNRFSDYVRVAIKTHSGKIPCVIQHELGHALGLRGHIDEYPNLMSSTSDCNTSDISEDGSNDYFDLFYDWFDNYFYNG